MSGSTLVELAQFGVLRVGDQRGSALTISSELAANDETGAPLRSVASRSIARNATSLYDLVMLSVSKVASDSRVDEHSTLGLGEETERSEERKPPANF